MTLPTVIANYNKKEAATRLQHSYAVLAEAVKMSEVENGPIEQWSLEEGSGLTVTKNFVEKYITPYLKFVKKDTLSTSSAPYKYSYYTRNKELVSSTGNTHYSIAIANGTYFHFNANYGISNKIECRIDINGKKGPNILGRDTFFASVYPKLELMGQGATRNFLLEHCSGNTEGDHKSCGALIQADGWQIKDDYPW